MDDRTTAGSVSSSLNRATVKRHRFRPETGGDWGYRPRCRDCDQAADHCSHEEER